MQGLVSRQPQCGRLHRMGRVPRVRHHLDSTSPGVTRDKGRMAASGVGVGKETPSGYCYYCYFCCWPDGQKAKEMVLGLRLRCGECIDAAAPFPAASTPINIDIL